MMKMQVFTGMVAMLLAFSVNAAADEASNSAERRGQMFMFNNDARLATDRTGEIYYFGATAQGSGRTESVVDGCVPRLDKSGKPVVKGMRAAFEVLV